MLRVMRAGGTRVGTMEECWRQVNGCSLPESFKLKLVNSLLRQMIEVSALQKGIEEESGFEADTASYLSILLAKEESDLMRRVSHCRCLKQDFDEKRLEWRKQKKSVINAIGSMTARTLRFEDKERKTIALHALAFYKNVMATDDGAIPGESESTDGLIDQYRRHRSEISKIPMYADSILKMLKDIRKTVRASSKLQAGPNPFAQFLEEWWASVVQFLQRSSIVEAEKNAREVMQTLKKLKGKQEESKKREISRLLSKLDDNAGRIPPTGRLSELPDPARTVPPSDGCTTPEDTSTRGWGGSRLPLTSGPPQQQGLKRDRDSHSSQKSELSTLPSAVVEGDDGELSPGSECPALNRKQAEQPRFQQHHLQPQPPPPQQQQQQRVSFADDTGHFEMAASRFSSSTSTSATTSRGASSFFRGSASAQAGGGNGNGGSSSSGSVRGSSNRPAALTVSVDDREAVGGLSGAGFSSTVNSLRSPASSGLRSPGTPSLTVGLGGGSMPSRVSWEEDSQGTIGTMDTAENMRVGVGFSGIPDSDDGEDGEDEDEELFEAADNLDLGAVDLCATGTGADGQMTYRDQDELRLPAKVAGPPQKKGVEQERFTVALDFFRQEQHGKTKRPALHLRPPSPMRTAASFSALPTASSLRSPRAKGGGAPFTPKLGGSGAVRVRTPASRSRGEGKEAKAKAVATRKRVSADRGAMTAKDKLLSATKSTSGRGQPLSRSLSVYVPSSRTQTTPTHRASKTPTVKSSRRALLSPGVRGFSRGAFFA